MKRRIIEFPHSMLKELVKVYVEGRLAVPRIYEDQTIDGRNLDLVGEKEIKGEVYKVFFEIKTGVVEPGYIEDYLDFCLKQKPHSAYLVMPVPLGETRFWEDEGFRVVRRELRVVPTEEVFRYVFNFGYRVIYGVIDGNIALILEPIPEPMEE